jgi:hypothetical protein
MGFLDDVRADRQALASVLKRHRGIRKIVEDLYPDRAHFIYELLQNAEDKGATKASFALTKGSIRFEHDGAPFSKSDIWGITDIGEGTKLGEEDKIGRFGVGFKAVFAYCESPQIWSPTFSFTITDLVLPTALSPKPELEDRTAFEFQFNNPKKNPDDAFSEVHAGLSELAETTLLFLTHLKSISWHVDDADRGQVLRLQHSDNHFEVLTKRGAKTTTSSHFLKFDQSVEGLEKQRVAVAFALDVLPDAQQIDTDKPLGKQMKIIPATPGLVAVFFPAEKEVSGLRFHLHAPFVPELSRASIKETPANQPLFHQLATLTAASLHHIRDMGLLTTDVLSVLPNPQDQIPERYKPIRAAIIEEMNNQSLTPTHFKSHAPAKYLLQAKASLKDLLSSEDIEFLIDYKDKPPQWATGATQKNTNADRLLSALATTQWDIDEFVAYLSDNASEEARYISSSRRYLTGPDQRFMSWLSDKSVDWHQKLYSLLYTELSPRGGCKDLNNSRIVRLIDGNYSTGRNCFLPSESVEHDDGLPRVDATTYTSGKSKLQQENARKFLEEIGVRQVGEPEQVEAILKQRYRSGPNLKPRKQDLRRFIGLFEKDAGQARLFAEYFIFEGGDGQWHNPARIFLDRPFLDTGLTAYFEALGKDAKRVPLASSYQDCGIAMGKLASFAKAVGAQTRLEILAASCASNPDWPYLRSVRGDRSTSRVDRDYFIPGLKEALSKPSLAISKLVWQTMSSLPPQPNCFQAQYQKSYSCGAHYASSQMVYLLKAAAWVPQGNDSFVRPAEASRDLLPEGFPFDAGWPWLKAVQFGEQERQRSEEDKKRQTTAKELGFLDSETLERAQQFAALPPADQERILADFKSKHNLELPEHEPHNPGLRAARVAQEASNAPRKIAEERLRSVSIDLDSVKQQAAEYLREQYTTDGEMICQICKGVLPFKLDDGRHYFEKVEFLEDLKNRYYQNYIALCPNHSAMFQHANGSRNVLKELFAGMADQRLEVILAQESATIYFTKTHVADLRQIIEVDSTRAAGSADASGEVTTS